MYVIGQEEGGQSWLYLGKGTERPLIESVSPPKKFNRFAKEYRELLMKEVSCVAGLKEALVRGGLRLLNLGESSGRK